jgi:hypothetical protein
MRNLNKKQVRFDEEDHHRKVKASSLKSIISIDKSIATQSAPQAAARQAISLYEFSNVDLIAKELETVSSISASPEAASAFLSRLSTYKKSESNKSTPSLALVGGGGGGLRSLREMLDIPSSSSQSSSSLISRKASSSSPLMFTSSSNSLSLTSLSLSSSYDLSKNNSYGNGSRRQRMEIGAAIRIQAVWRGVFQRRYINQVFIFLH